MSGNSGEMEAARRVFLLLAQVGHEWSSVIREIRGGAMIVDNAALAVMCRLQPGAVRPVDLQNSITMTSGGMSKLIDRLEEAGLVARLAAKPPEDGRGVQVALTRKGQTLLNEVLTVVSPRVHQVSADLARILAELEGEEAQEGTERPRSRLE